MTDVLTDVLTSCNDPHMNQPTACKFQIAQSVEVLGFDFKAASQPRAWFAGVVEAVSLRDEARSLWDVRVRLADGSFKVETVGPRGGGKRVRVAA